MSQLIYTNGDYLRDTDSLIQDIVSMSEDIHKLDANPTSAQQKKIVTVKLTAHIEKTKELLIKINSITKNQ